MVGKAGRVADEAEWPLRRDRAATMDTSRARWLQVQSWRVRPKSRARSRHRKSGRLFNDSVAGACASSRCGCHRPPEGSARIAEHRLQDDRRVMWIRRPGKVGSDAWEHAREPLTARCSEAINCSVIMNYAVE